LKPNQSLMEKAEILLRLRNCEVRMCGTKKMAGIDPSERGIFWMAMGVSADDSGYVEKSARADRFGLFKAVPCCVHADSAVV
jgi:hypothetical protein